MPPADESPAEVARRRLAELAASFHATLPDLEDDPGPAPAPRVTSSHVRWLAACGAVVVLVGGWWLFSGSSGSAPVAEVRASVPSGPTSAPPPSAPAELIIDVAGKVKHPGIVTVPAGSRVHDAITAAGGTVGSPDLSDLNLARVLSDGEQIRVGLPAVASVGGAGASGGPGSGAAPVNLNTATQADLESLPGVGPVTAQAIVSWRQTHGRFSTVEDLLDVRGIGEATLAELRPHVVV